MIPPEGHPRPASTKKEWDLVGDPTLKHHSKMADKFANLFRRSDSTPLTATLVPQL